MAKTKTNIKSKSKKIHTDHLKIALTNKNYAIIGAGILIIILGYIFMSENSVDGFLPTVLAPILLVLGYCVIVPIGILFKDKNSNEDKRTDLKDNNETKGNIISGINV